MNKFSVLIIFFWFYISFPLWSLDFSNFLTRGYEGKGPLEFIAPEDLILGPNGEIIVADSKNNRIQVLYPDGSFERFISPEGKVPEIASHAKVIGSHSSKIDSAPPREGAPKDGSSKKVRSEFAFNQPVGLALDDKGRLLVSSAGDNIIWIFRFKDGELLGSIGERGRGPGQFITPMDIDIRYDGLLAVADSGNQRIQILDSSGKFLQEIYYKEEIKNKKLRPLAPRGVFWLKNGDLMVSYPTFHQVVCWDIKGVPRWQYGAFGKGKGELNQPSYIAQGPGDELFISDTKNHRLINITNTGYYVKHFSGQGTSPGRLLSPRGLVLTKDESLIICDQGNNRVHFFKLSKVASILRDARMLAEKDRWDDAIPKIEQALNLEPNDSEARNLMISALHFFGDRSCQNNNFPKAEESYRRVLLYNPQDTEVQKKLDAVFWAKNKDLIMQVSLVISGIIITLILFWVIKIMFRRFVFSSK